MSFILEVKIHSKERKRPYRVFFFTSGSFYSGSVPAVVAKICLHTDKNTITWHIAQTSFVVTSAAVGVMIAFYLCMITHAQRLTR